MTWNIKRENAGFKIRSFQNLTTNELYEILRARADIFVGEEKILYPDADGIDYESVHVFSMDQSGMVTAYLRMYAKADEPGVIQMGRVLTRSHGHGDGRKLLRTAIRAAQKDMNAMAIYVESQKQAAGFYFKEGFTAETDDFLEAGIWHVGMRKRLIKSNVEQM